MALRWTRGWRRTGLVGGAPPAAQSQTAGSLADGTKGSDCLCAKQDRQSFGQTLVDTHIQSDKQVDLEGRQGGGCGAPSPWLAALSVDATPIASRSTLGGDAGGAPPPAPAPAPTAVVEWRGWGVTTEVRKKVMMRSRPSSRTMPPLCDCVRQSTTTRLAETALEACQTEEIFGFKSFCGQHLSLPFAPLAR